MAHATAGAILALILVAMPATAQRGVHRELALAVAQVAVNEATLALIQPADLYLIWQITEGHGDTPGARLAWLRSHSRRVLGIDPCTAGNCLWSAGLTWSDAEPPGWPTALAWRGRYERRWRQVREMAARLVRGEEYEPPCVLTPDTWGGPMDHARALAHGMVQVVCAGTANAGYIVP